MRATSEVNQRQPSFSRKIETPYMVPRCRPPAITTVSPTVANKHDSPPGGSIPSCSKWPLCPTAITLCESGTPPPILIGSLIPVMCSTCCCSSSAAHRSDGEAPVDKKMEYGLLPCTATGMEPFANTLSASDRNEVPATERTNARRELG